MTHSRGAKTFVDELLRGGVHHFTTHEAERGLGRTRALTQQALHRLRDKGEIASPLRGFHIIVPPHYRDIGCLPPRQFVPQLMAHLGLDYYVGLLSAAEIHGAAHHRPQVFQVVVESARRDIVCGQEKIVFVGRNNVADMPVQTLNTPRGTLRLSTPEVTAFDLVGYPRRAGGLDNIATVLTELLEEGLDGARLAQVAPLSPVLWAQRLGFLLELVGADTTLTAPLHDHVAAHAYRNARLSPRRAHGDALDERWKLYINTRVEPDV